MFLMKASYGSKKTKAGSLRPEVQMLSGCEDSGSMLLSGA
jgi:hypothetical protein